MNYSHQQVEERLDAQHNTGVKLTSRLILHALKLLFCGGVVAAILAAAFLYGTVQGIIDTAPDAESLTVSPLGIASAVYDTEGRVTETLITTGSNRDPIALSEVPQDLIDAFVAIEDERFWTHEGVDVRSILRTASSLLLHGSISGGASTITQQLIKNNIFDGGMERGWGARFIRKFQEQYLAILLESESSKEDILANYLNTINLGSNCLGVQVASQRYFSKDVGELTLSECACIAAITQNPYKYNPIQYPANNAARRMSVLNHMLDQEYISDEEWQSAVDDTDALYERIRENNLKITESRTPYSYFTDALISEVLNDLQTELGYSEADAYTMLYSGGLNIYTTQDSRIQAVLDAEVNNPENYPADACKYSFTYRVNATLKNGTSVTYSENNVRKTFNLSNLVYNSKEEIQDLIRRFKAEVFTEGDVIADEKIYYTLQPQLSAVIMDQSTGQVKAITGARGEKEVSRALNRATSSYRSPGSTFKVLSTFAPGLDTGVLTLSDVQLDVPYSYNGSAIRNWWDSSINMGYCSARQAIVYSMNVISVNFLMNRVGVETAFNYLENFGISSLVREKTIDGKLYTDLVPTLCLGSLTNGATLLDVTNAYAAIADEGVYHEAVFYTKITDHNGNVLLEKPQDTHRVLKESTAYLLTNAMAESMTDERLKQTWYTASSGSAALEKMPAAGKSGTSTDNTGRSRDYWFIGYTGYYTMGIWSGFDDGTVPLEGNVTMNNYHKTVWKKVMDTIHKDLPVKKFVLPQGVVTARVCSLSGKLAVNGLCDHDELYPVYTEYYESGSEPTEYCDCHIIVDICDETGLEAGRGCPSTHEEYYYNIPEPPVTTLDSPFIYHSKGVCTEHESLIEEDDGTEETDAAGENDEGTEGTGDTGENNESNESDMIPQDE